MVKECPGFKEETCFDSPFFFAEEVVYMKVNLEHIPDTRYYRKNFVGKGIYILI
jgi:hypothetical protein